MEPSLEMNPFTLAFKSPVVEGEFLGELANRRWPVLMFIFVFDVLCFLLRFAAKLTSAVPAEGVDGAPAARPVEVAQEMGHQLANMGMLYVLIGLLNKRARKAGDTAARQEEILLSICMGLAICNLLASLGPDNVSDYVYMCFFLICTSTFLKIRWWVGTAVFLTPTVASRLWWYSRPPAPEALLPPDAVVHIVVAWAVGGLMAYLSDWYRRQMFANARLACAAHEKEMLEATARIQAQRELAAAQAQAAQRALTMARAKAAHDAKSEFMSLMCHEVRTPLNGCLASAEMLLETPLKEEQRELANTIRVSGSILLSTVSNFLDFFKLEAGKRLDIVRSEVQLSHLVGDVHCIIEAMIGRGGAVDLKQPELNDVPELVLCDPDRLRGILLNLYTNAAKFTKHGTIQLRVTAVPHDHTPPAPPGYSAIVLQPRYHPSPSSHRSMDISSCVMLTPAADGPAEEAAQHLGGALPVPAPAPAPVSAAASGAGGTEGPPHQQEAGQQQARRSPAAGADSAGGLRQRQPQQDRQKAQEQEGQRQGQRHLEEQPQHKDHGEQQQHTLWSQASSWVGSLLPALGREGAASPPAAAAGAQEDVCCCRSSPRSSGSGRGSSGRLSNLVGAAAPGPPDLGPADKPHGGPDVGSGSGSGGGGPGAGAQYELRAESCSALVGGGAGAAPSPAAAQQPACLPPAAPGSDGGGSAGGRSGGGEGGMSAPEDEACWLLFEVWDTGVGITRDGLATLFREYVQGTDDEMCQPRARGGTGLGLSICSKQVAVLGGIIGAHSCRGRGSNFFFKIPVYVRHGGVKRGVQAPHAAQAEQAALAAGRQQQQQQQQRQEEEAGGRGSEGAGASSSNSGTWNVVHSGLYQPTARAPAGKQGGGGGGGGGADHAASPGEPTAPVAAACSGRKGGGSGGGSRSGGGSSTGGGRGPGPAAPGSSGGGGGGAAAAASAAVAVRTAALPPPGPSAPSAAAATPPPPPPQQPPRQSLSFDGRPAPALDTSRLAGRRVLLAEDNLINQTVARKMLSTLGMEVEVAANGLEAVQAVRRAAEDARGGSRQQYALVLMDLLMPTMNGVDATRSIRAEGHALPIVAMTANASDKDRDECAAAGMNGFLSKPVLRDQLARAILAALSDADRAEEGGGGGGGGGGGSG